MNTIFIAKLKKTLALTFFLLASEALFAQTKPNIILFLVDDMGWQDTEVPFHTDTTAFNRHYVTPTMTKLAKSGVKFTNAYAHAVCSPTRTSIMTGLSPARHHVTNWTKDKDKETSKTTKNLKAPIGWKLNGIQSTTITLPKLLRNVGYKTIHAGKAHWGAGGTSGADPQNLGFDVNIGGSQNGGPGHYWGENNFSSGGWAMGPGLESYYGQMINLTDALTLEVNKAVKTSVQEGKPFYLYMAHYAVHVPIQAHRTYVQKYLDKGVNSTEAKYASMIEGMDASLKSILATVDSLGVSENTIVVFTSDNGGLTHAVRKQTPMGTGRNTHNRPLKAGKGSAYEGGTRVPLIVSWAKNSPQNLFKINANTTSSQQIICEDYFPTFLKWANAPLPASLKDSIEGQNITDFIKGDTTSMRTNTKLFFHYPHKWGPNGPGFDPHSSMRNGDLKVIYFYESEKWELYDLSKDIGETNNLINTNKEDLYVLATQLMNGLEQRNAQYPALKTNNQPRKPIIPTRPTGLVIGCRDTNYVEYSSSVNYHDRDSCLTSKVVSIKNVRQFKKVKWAFEQNYLTINSSENYQLKIMNTMGKIIFHANKNSSKSHDLSMIRSQGLHFFHLQFKRHKEVHKIFIWPANKI